MIGVKCPGFLVGGVLELLKMSLLDFILFYFLLLILRLLCEEKEKRI